MTNPKTLYRKIWDSHIVTQIDDQTYLLYIDIHYIHEVTSPQAFAGLRNRNLGVRRPQYTFATTDHNVPTIDQKIIRDALSKLQIDTLKRNCKDFGITLYDLNNSRQGIVHIIGPELGISQPGTTIVCGDSHTSTHGAFGTLAFGIGTTEVEQVLATQCLIQRPMKSMEIQLNGMPQKGVTAKDIILAVIAKIGIKGGTGFCIEYTGNLIPHLTMENRMTLCNMSIEAGARTGMMAPDDVTINYLHDKPFAPKDTAWTQAVEGWKKLKTDKEASYDKSVTININMLEPLVTYGTDPSTGIPVTEKIPDPKKAKNPEEQNTRRKALEYMGLKPGMKLEGFPVDYVFIGSCTNARLSDIREASRIVKGKKVKSGITAFIVPGSQSVKKQAEKEGLDRIFIEAGFQWRWPGCSACIAMNEDRIPPKKYCVSTNNRNFEGRQGPGSRTFLASPIMAAAAAIEGKITDVRKYL